MYKRNIKKNYPFKQRIIIQSSLFILQIKQYKDDCYYLINNNNHVNKVDKYLEMFSFKLINLTIALVKFN